MNSENMILNAASVGVGATTQPINETQIILIFLAFFLSVVVVTTIKKIYYRLWLKKKYFVIPRPGIRGIASISMVIALSVAVLILMTIITSNLFSVLFRAFPGTRVTIEGILIKIGGLLFGPFLGLFIGMMTDLLSVLMTAGIFHYGYFIAALAYGLIAGLIRTIVTFSSKSKLKFAIYSSITLIITAAAAFFYVNAMVPAGTNLTIEFGITLSISKEIAIAYLCGFIPITLIVIWSFYGISKRRENINKKPIRKPMYFSDGKPDLGTMVAKNKKKKKQDKFLAFCAVITCVVVTEMFVNVFAMPHFDAAVTSLTVLQWFAIRSALFIPMVFLNMFIIYPVYTIVTPLVTYDYEKELSESINIKMYED